KRESDRERGVGDVRGINLVNGPAQTAAGIAAAIIGGAVDDVGRLRDGGAGQQEQCEQCRGEGWTAAEGWESTGEVCWDSNSERTGVSQGRSSQREARARKGEPILTRAARRRKKL